jgi:signal transduction histidine kinase/ActR/RegA family two-component response regulator
MTHESPIASRSSRFSPSRLGLRERLTIVFAVLLGAIALTINQYVPARYERLATEAMRGRLTGLAEVQAFSVRSAVVFGDTFAIHESLRGTMLSDEAVYVSVRDTLGGLIAESWSPTWNEEADSRAITVTASIKMDDVRLGTVHLVASPAELESYATDSRAFIGLVSAVIFIAGTLFTIAISVSVTGSLSRIIRSTRRIAQGDLHHRTVPDGPDELRSLATSINEMVDRLQGAQAETEQSQQELQRILDNLPLAVMVYDLNGKILYVNPAAVREPEWREWIMGKTEEEYWRHRGFSTVDKSIPSEAVRQTVSTRSFVEIEDSVLVMPDGTSRTFVRGYTRSGGPSDDAGQVIGYALDVTERAAAEQALQESEERLRQSQKMESLGRLAGGVAHDFNNLLAAIIAHCDLLLEDLVDHEPRSDVIAISGAATRAADLTSQLLAFSRKQVLQPKLIDLNSVVGSVTGLLRRLLGAQVRLELLLAEDLPSVYADTGQLEQAILNLAVNANDAMPEGGLLSMTTDVVDLSRSLKDLAGLGPGLYVRLSVTDTGIGMDAATKAKIFEPFFTTKPAGQGTGLGLATIFGILEQSGGTVTAYSEVGVGSTFRLYLPAAERRVEDGPEPDRLANAEVDEESLSGGETILLVEDTPSVRHVASRILGRLGYQVLETESAREALAALDDHDGVIDMVLTDVVMPDMGGTQMAQIIKALRPDLPILFMSGYTFDALHHRGVLEEGVALIEKPFTAVELARAVREQLDRIDSPRV